MESVTLTQRSFPLTKLCFTVEGNRDLVVEHRSLFRSTRQAFPLHLIDLLPIHHRQIPFGWVVITTLSSLLVVGALLGGWASQGPGEQFGLLFLAGIFLACLYNTAKLSRSTIHYRNANTAAILFSMFRGRPSRSEVDSFAETLKSRIESFRTPAGASAEELIGLYRRHLDYLLENDVLLRAEYDAIVTRLDERKNRRRRRSRSVMRRSARASRAGRRRCLHTVWCGAGDGACGRPTPGPNAFAPRTLAEPAVTRSRPRSF